MIERRASLHSVNDVVFDPSKVYDFALVTCGYERRSSFLARSGLTAGKQIAVRHDGAEELSFADNLASISSAGWDLEQEDETIALLVDHLKMAESELAIDISSMPRRFLGRVIQSLSEAPHGVIVDWLYAPAVFDESAVAASAIHPLIADPVSEFFSGAIRNPLMPVGLIMGLGLEPYRAIGLMEFLEPARVWAMLGESDEPRFADHSREINRELVDLPTTTLLPYPVSSLAGTFSALESLVFATQDSYRLVIAPSGPKIFGLASLLVGSSPGQLRPAVWRVGGQADAVRSDVTESGVVASGRSKWHLH